MSSPDFSKSACTACGSNIEFPTEAVGLVVACPHCNESTALGAIAATPREPIIAASEPTPPPLPPAPVAVTLDPDELVAAFQGHIPRTPVSPLYQIGLVIVAITMVVLPIIYVGLVGLAGWVVYYWATHFTFLLGGSGGVRVWLFKLFFYLTPLLSGITVVFFMIKPLLARSPKAAQPLALNPESEPVLYAYIAKICTMVGAPLPRRIDIDCELNASAGFRRGFLSMFGKDLVLTIGLPLVAGLNTRQLAGVLAHEFGHFTQGFGMRLTYVIRRVNGWFARVVYQRDAWDVTLEETTESCEDWRLMIMLNMVRLAVWFSRLLLKLLMWTGHGIGCFMLRQMEYDADSYEIKLAGSSAFEDTMRRFHVLGAVSNLAYKDMRVGWNNGHTLPDDYPRWLMYHDTRLDPQRRTKLEDTMGMNPTGFFDTHPSNGDRIRRARQAEQPGVFHIEAPATFLFNNFDAVSKQVTHLHYADDLGIPLDGVKLMPVPKPGESTEPAPEPAPQAESPAKDAGKLRPRLKLKSHIPD